MADDSTIDQLIHDLADQPLAADLLIALLSDRMRQNQRAENIQDASHAVQTRILQAGAVVTNDTSSVGRDVLGTSTFDTLNFQTGSANVNANNPRQIDIRAGGSGSDCMFDYLVSACWATEVTALRGVEGQTMTSASGCTFKMYSTAQLAWDAVKLTTGNKIVALCSGDAGPLSIAADGTSGEVTFIGFGKSAVISATGATAAYTNTATAAANKTLAFDHINFAPASGYAADKSSGTGQFHRFRNCVFSGPVRWTKIGTIYWNCEFTSVGGTSYVYDALANQRDVWLFSCVFSGPVRPGAEDYYQNCTTDGGGSLGIGFDCTGGAGGTSCIVSGHAFRGGSFTNFFKIGSYCRIDIRNCAGYTGGASGAAIVITSAYNQSGGDGYIVGNDFNTTLGLDIQSANFNSVTYVGNNHGYQTGLAFTGVQTSGAGVATNCIFGVNGPSGILYSLSASSANNRFDGILQTTAAPTLAAPEGTLAFDKTANTMYANTDGSTTWAILGTAGGVGAGGPYLKQDGTTALTGSWDQSGAFTIVQRGSDLVIANSKSLRLYSDDSATPSTLTGQWNATTGHIGVGGAASSTQPINILKSIGSGNTRGVNVALTSTTASASGAQRVTGLLFSVILAAASGTQANAHGVYGAISHSGAEAVTNLDSMFLDAMQSVAGNGAIATASAIRIAAAAWGGTIPTTTYLLNGADQGNAAANLAYGLYVPPQTGIATRSYIGDPLVVGGADRAKAAALDLAGDIRLDGVAASGTPASDDLVVYNETTTKLLKAKDDAAAVYDLTHKHLVNVMVDGTVTNQKTLAGPMPHAGTITDVTSKTCDGVTIGATAWVGNIYKIPAANINTDGGTTSIFTTAPTITNTNMRQAYGPPDLTTTFAAGDYFAFATTQIGTNATMVQMGMTVRYT